MTNGFEIRLMRPKIGSEPITAPFEPPDWSRIETVCLDMDGTVLDLRFDNYFWQDVVPRRYGALHGLTPRAALEELTPRIDAWRGRLEWYCVDHWTRELGLDIEALKSEFREHIRFLPGSERFLDRLGALGKRRLLTTNAHPKALSVKDRQTGIGRHFDVLVSSHALGAVKETPEFWRRLMEAYGIEPASTLCVDDHPEVLGAAQSVGIDWLYQVLQPDSTQPPGAQVSGVCGIVRLDRLLPQALARGP
jgi:putative hydrolase of the HAD superfamily